MATQKFVFLIPPLIEFLKVGPWLKNCIYLVT